MRISVAVKLVIFFGLSITVVVMAALAVPWLWMQSLADEMAVETARQAARIAAARVGMPEAGDWKNRQEQLSTWWVPFSRQTEGLPPEAPRLIPIDPTSHKLPDDADSFLLSAVDYLRSHPEKRELNRSVETRKGRVFRYVMAIRSPATHGKGELLGLIEPLVSPAITQEQLWWNRAVILTAAGMSLIMALLLFTLVARNLILRPVKKLRDVADQVAAGDLAVRVEMRTRDEFQRLAEATNNMLESLQRSQEDLRKINRSLDVKIGELAELNEALYVANKLKSQFVASVSHELRTPLSSIIGFAELLTQSPTGTDMDVRIQRYSGNILSSGRMLLELINDLLDLAKIEAGKLELHVQDISLQEVCEGLYDFMKPLADKAGLHFELQCDKDLPRMHSDAGKIKQILYNLLSNAVKFTQPEGRVTLGARPAEAGCVQIWVSDTGPGISKEQQALVFEKFRQLDEGATRQHGGVGLGLAISKELVTLLGGQIGIQSEPGQGTTFTVILPVAAGPLPASEPAPAEGKA
jgi:two-component system, NarL family, sensor histidine kinase BarA